MQPWGNSSAIGITRKSSHNCVTGSTLKWYNRVPFTIFKIITFIEIDSLLPDLSAGKVKPNPLIHK